MKKLSNIIIITCFSLTLLAFFSCSKKSQQTDIGKRDTTVISDSSTTKGETDLKSSSSHLTNRDVIKKFGEIKKKYENELDEVGKSEVKFVDIANDGKEYAILNYNLVAKGGNIMTGSGLVLYKIVKDKLEFLLDYNLDGAVVKSVKDGYINCLKYEYAPGDPECCPSKKKPIRLKFENEKLSRIN